MPPTIIQKLKEAIDQSKKILIIFPENFNGDIISSSLALFLFLKKMGGEVNIVSKNFVLPSKYSFLEGSNQIKEDLSLIRNLVISVDLKNNKIGELSYEVVGEKLNIYLSPKKRIIAKNDISLALGKYNYDLVFVLGCQKLENLGEIYHQYLDFLQKTILVNIDYHSGNKNFGQINIIDVTSISLGELIYKIIKSLKQDLIDSEIATSLLTGIVSATNFFRSPETNQHTLLAASQLISLGGNKKKIIQNLQRGKSVAVLKLWGRILARLKGTKDNKIAWSLINKEDFLKAGISVFSSEKEEERVFWEISYELTNSLPQAKVVLILYEKKEGVSVYLYSKDEKINAQDLVQLFSPQGDKERAKIKLINKNIIEAEKLVIEEIKKNI